MTAYRQRVLVVTPGMNGDGGIAALSRLVIRALDAATDRPSPLEILSLGDGTGLTADAAGWMQARLVGGAGSKARFVASALRAARRPCRNAWVICLHLNLSPVALPFLWRGARLATVLCGIEAWKPLGLLRTHTLLRSDPLVAISGHTATRFREANPQFRSHPIEVCHPAVPSKAPEAQTFPAHRNVNTSALIVGRMAAAERYKGHDELLSIWPRVITDVPAAHLLVAGDGDDRPRLEARAAQLGLQKHVTFLGRVPTDDLAALYRDCTFFVMPSCDEGFGLVFLEAMRAGKACIGAPGAAAEIIRHGETGLLVDPNRPAELQAAVSRLFREPETRTRMGRAGAQRWAQQFTEACFRRRFLTLLGLEPEAATCAA